MSDPTNKFAGMFQDAAGTIPVTKSGDPVGLCKSYVKGEVPWYSKVDHRPFFRAPEKAECHWDPEDMSTLFQDRAGKIPVVKLGDPVQLCVDKTGNGNHLAPDKGAFYDCDEGGHYISLPLDPITGIARNHYKKGLSNE